jgi:UDP-N-acetylmuramyl pentapeptide phosphotransferase/UDP-N-acetylglucosamine-1-phosphate transferase
MQRWPALAQGLYYAASGAWPLLSMRSFESVTGPKADKWLVRTVGGLVAVIGAVLSSAAARRRVHSEVVLLGVATAASLAAIDVVYATRGRISKIYLLDAFAEIALIGAWASVLARRLRDPGSR